MDAVDGLDHGVEHRMYPGQVCLVVPPGPEVHVEATISRWRQVLVPLGRESRFGEMQDVFGAVIHSSQGSLRRVFLVYIRLDEANMSEREREGTCGRRTSATIALTHASHCSSCFH
ncbi:hypothetical protein HMPREF1868_00936 [Olsenella sp. DNF00959]|nr:hypothetical protein HMPREF1868_00936 [Olsenella sp. DNF00959]